jgi:hypothetical protein
MGCFTRILVAVLAGSLLAAGAAGLPDTGQLLDYDGTLGRDAAAGAGVLVKVGGGAAGFDYTKLGANGTPLAIQNQPWTYDKNGADNGSETAGTRWTCVRDNSTGLTWQTHAKGDMNQTFTWFDSSYYNGGEPGARNAGSCSFTGYCDTENWAILLSTLSYCGSAIWRVPTRRELLTLVHAGARNPSIDTSYFPNTQANGFWTATTELFNLKNAWVVNFSDGATHTAGKSYGAYLTLVHGTSF